MKLKNLAIIVLGVILLSTFSFNVKSCTNYLVTKSASVNGSTMITYAADWHILYGTLFFSPAADYPEGTMLKIFDGDTNEYYGNIPQATHTYQVVGFMNEFQLSIGETTYGGIPELLDTAGIIDYGSLMRLALQRAKTAREAIKVMTELVEKYGYASSGESFSIADPEEVWILEMIGKGPGNKGAVWVARMIPDGYVSGHANHARITTFPLEKDKTSITSHDIDQIFNKEITTVYANDVIDFAREYGIYEGKNKDFSFSDTYAPLSFTNARFAEARVWSFFRKVNNDMEKYFDYVSGHDLSERMPLWIKPDRKISNLDMMDFMRDHFEGTPLDMTKDAGAGPFGLPYRWRPLTWSVEGDDTRYLNERATATQQTAYSFVAEMRGWLPDPVGGIYWLGMDDAASTCYIPFYAGVKEIPREFTKGNGDLITYSPTSAFWTFAFVSNFAYLRYDSMSKDIRRVQKPLEEQYAKEIMAVDEAAVALINNNEKQAALDFITTYSNQTAVSTVQKWKELGQFLLIKYMDGNIKKEVDGKFLRDEYGLPPMPDQPGYPDKWKKMVIQDTGDKLKIPSNAGGH